MTGTIRVGRRDKISILLVNLQVRDLAEKAEEVVNQVMNMERMDITKNSYFGFMVSQHLVSLLERGHSESDP